MAKISVETSIKIREALDIVHRIRVDLGIQSVIEVEVLLAVMAQEGQSQGEIGAIVELEQNRMSNIIPRLRSKNLVDDYVVTGRTKAIDLTPKSRRLRDNIKG